MYSDNNKKIIQTEQTQQLFSGLPVSLLSSLILATLLCFASWRAIDHEIVIRWYLLVLFISLARLVLLLVYRRSNSVGQTVNWLLWYRIGVISAALIWGSSGIILFSTDNITHQAFLAFFLTGYASGATMAYSIDVVCAIPFVIAALTPFLIRLLFAGGEFSTTMGMAVALFIVFVVISMRRICRSTIEKIVIQIQATNRANALYESETKLRTFYDSTSDAIVLMDSFKIIDCNKAALELFGCISREKLFTKSLSDLSTPSQSSGMDSSILVNQMMMTAMSKGSTG